MPFHPQRQGFQSSQAQPAFEGAQRHTGGLGQQPEPFRQKNPQEQALHYKVPCYARIGGTVIKNLKGVVYCDGV